MAIIGAHAVWLGLVVCRRHPVSSTLGGESSIPRGAERPQFGHSQVTILTPSPIDPELSAAGT